MMVSKLKIKPQSGANNETRLHFAQVGPYGRWHNLQKSFSADKNDH